MFADGVLGPFDEVLACFEGSGAQKAGLTRWAPILALRFLAG